MARVLGSPQARKDLEAVGDDLAREAPAYAHAFVDGASAAVERLEVFPTSAAPYLRSTSHALREIIYRGDRVLYMVSGSGGETEVDVLSVFHSAGPVGGGSGFESG